MRFIILSSLALFLLNCGSDPEFPAEPADPQTEAAVQTALSSKQSIEDSARAAQPAPSAIEDSANALPTAGSLEKQPLESPAPPEPPETQANQPPQPLESPAAPPELPEASPPPAPQPVANPCKGNLRFLEANCDIPIPDWLAEARIRNEIVSLSSEGAIWHRGVWLDGTFKGALWKSGEFRGGTWQGGRWLNGIWLAEGKPY